MRTPVRAVVLALALIASLTVPACKRAPQLPVKGSAAYAETISCFYVGLSAQQAGDDQRAKERLRRASDLAPGEPAIWANLGLLELKQREFDPAAQHLEQARALAPDNADIYLLLATLESARGGFESAIRHLQRALELDTKNVRASYSLGQEFERQGDDASSAKALKLYQDILINKPQNLAAQLEVARLAAKLGNPETLARMVNLLGARATAWPPPAREQFETLRASADSANPRAAAPRVAFLRNVLLQQPEFRQSLFELRLPPETLGLPFTRPLKLEVPDFTAAVPDRTLAFGPTTSASSADANALWAGPVFLDGTAGPVESWVDGKSKSLHIGAATVPFPLGTASLPLPRSAVAQLDFDYDFKTDLALVGAGGFRLLRQIDTTHFADITVKTGLPAHLLGQPYIGCWPADLDLDGDLDLVLAPVNAPPFALRNNGDGTLTQINPLPETTKIKDFVYADLDEDGDPDAIVLDDAGAIAYFENERGGVFTQRPAPPRSGPIAAFALGDATGDARLDLVLLQVDGAIRAYSSLTGSNPWAATEIASASAGANQIAAGAATLIIADFDNNGGNDLLVSTQAGSQVWLSDQTGKFAALGAAVEVQASGSGDSDADGLLDLYGVQAGTHVIFRNHASAGYHWQTLRPQSASATGDQRINPFGIGGEMELRAGLLTQKQVIASPVVHFGLGQQLSADVVRVVWPNGSVQGEFDLKADQSVVANQRLKGSCPHLFAWDGKRMRFIKDAPPWSPALGLRINAQVTAGVQQREEWFKLPGDAVAPTGDGFYDLRITAELWETFYIDHYELTVVDHPAGTEIFTDERFGIPPPELAIRTTHPPLPYAHATDDLGQDVAQTVRDIDGQFLDTFGRGQYQGVTRDHFVELDLPQSAPQSGKLWLVGSGWLHPTDASINVAIGQGSHAPPQGLSIEIPDGQGGWQIAKKGLGFPAGKNKTILLDLSDIHWTGPARVLRLRTNMEIYWDQLAWTTEAPAYTVAAHQQLASAELRYRGFSEFSKASQSAPELPDYDKLETTTQKWRDLEGYYTRFGDVRELLQTVDDRYVIVNAGDELVLRFPALAPPPAGQKRDFVIVGYGWIKDGDLNSWYSKTVLPLPTHATSDYTSPPRNLEDEAAYRQHPEDWQNFHTRYVAPDQFRNNVRSVRGN